MAFLQLIGTVALFLGLLFGMMVNSCLFDGIDHSARHSLFYYMPVLGVLAIYILLTGLILLIRSERWGASPVQIRVVWFLAFILSSIGAPLVIWFGSS